MLWRIILTVIAYTFLSASHSEAQTPATDRYQIDLVLSKGGQVIGTPRLTVLPGQAAIMTTSGVNAYTLKVVFEPTTIKGSAAADLRMELRLDRNGTWQDVAAPRLMGLIGNSIAYETVRATSMDGTIRIEAKVTRAMAKPTADAVSPCGHDRLEAWESRPISAPVQQAALQAGDCCRTKCFTCCGSSACCCDQYRCPGICCCT